MMGMTDWRSNHRPERWSAPLIRNATDAAEAWWKALPDGYKCKPHEVRLLAAIDVLRRLPTDDPLTVEDNDGQPCEVANAKTEDLLKAFSTDNKQALADPTVYGEGFACLSAAAAGLGFPEPPPLPNLVCGTCSARVAITFDGNCGACRDNKKRAAESAISDAQWSEAQRDAAGDICSWHADVYTDRDEWKNDKCAKVCAEIAKRAHLFTVLSRDACIPDEVLANDLRRTFEIAKPGKKADWWLAVAQRAKALLSRSARQVVLPKREALAKAMFEAHRTTPRDRADYGWEDVIEVSKAVYRTYADACLAEFARLNAGATEARKRVLPSVAVEVRNLEGGSSRVMLVSGVQSFQVGCDWPDEHGMTGHEHAQWYAGQLCKALGLKVYALHPGTGEREAGKP